MKLTQEQIDKMVGMINTVAPYKQGVCYAMNILFYRGQLSKYLGNGIMKLFPLPLLGTGGFCWPLTPEGDEQRKEFLRGLINHEFE